MVQNATLLPQWPGDVMVRAFDLQLEGHGFDSWLLFRFQVTNVCWASCSHTCLLSPSSINLYRSSKAVMPYSREGNRRSGITRAVHHRLSVLSTSGLIGLVREMSTLPALHKGLGWLYIHLLPNRVILENFPEKNYETRNTKKNICQHRIAKTHSNSSSERNWTGAL